MKIFSTTPLLFLPSNRTILEVFPKNFLIKWKKKNERRRGEEWERDKAKASFSFPELRFFWSASRIYADQKDRSSKK